MDDTSPTSKPCSTASSRRAFIEDAVRQPGLPSTVTIGRIADFENTITAVLALIEL